MHLHLDRSPGLGHKQRLLALSQEWVRRGSKTERYLNRAPSGPAVHVFDGYAFNSSDLKKAKKTGGVVVYMSDYSGSMFADIIVLPWLIGNLWDKVGRVKGVSYLTGPEYFPLRDSFKQIPSAVDDGKPVKLDEIFDCDAVNRAMHPNTFTWHMAQAKVIICSAGITAYESMYLGKPTLLRIRAENQRLNYDNLIKQGYALPRDMAPPMRLSYDGRKKLSERGKSLVDGLGTKRICDKIVEMLDG